MSKFDFGLDNVDYNTKNLDEERQKIEREREELEKEKKQFEKDKEKIEKKLGVYLFNSTVKKMFDDEEFINKLNERISEITMDGKVDAKDIPDLMLIILDVTDNLSKLNLTYEEVLKVLEEFVIYIIESKDLVREKDREDVNRLIKTAIKLTLARPQVSNWFKKIYANIKSKLCCC